MYGAILGDIIGSPYEWHNKKSKDFPLLSKYSRFTDDKRNDRMKKTYGHEHSHHHHEEAEGMHASRMSQLGNEPCTVEDSEEMASLRNAEDASTLMKLGGLLISQYRYREAIPVMEKAAEMEPESAKIQSKLGGTKLTLFRIEEALHHYYRALELGAAADHETVWPCISCLAAWKDIKRQQIFDGKS